MSLYPLFYLVVVALGFLASLLRGPIWGLLTYVFIYFNIPTQQWWGGQVPDLRWSLVSAGVLVASCFLHSDQLSSVRLSGEKPFQYLVGLFALMTLLVPFSVSPTAFGRLYEFFRLVVIYALIIKVIANRQHLRYFIYVFLIELAYLGYMAHYYFRGGRLGGVGTPDASEANTFASLLIMGIPLLVFFIFRGKLFEKLLAFPALLLVMNAFIMCRSRGGFLALAVTWVAMLFTFDARYRKHMFFASIAAGLMFVLLADPGYLNRLRSLENPLEHSAGRWEIWQYGIQMIEDHPIGTGGEGFMYLSPFYMPEWMLSQGRRAAHNTFLQVTVEQGILGFFLYLGFLFYTYKGFLGASRSGGSTGDLEGGFLGKFLLGSFAGILAASLFLDRLYSEALYWICALSVVCNHLMLQEAEAENFASEAEESRVSVSWKSAAP